MVDKEKSSGKLSNINKDSVKGDQKKSNKFVSNSFSHDAAERYALFN